MRVSTDFSDSVVKHEELEIFGLQEKNASLIALDVLDDQTSDESSEKQGQTTQKISENSLSKVNNIDATSRGFLMSCLQQELYEVWQSEHGIPPPRRPPVYLRYKGKCPEYILETDLKRVKEKGSHELTGNRDSLSIKKNQKIMSLNKNVTTQYFVHVVEKHPKTNIFDKRKPQVVNCSYKYRLKREVAGRLYQPVSLSKQVIQDSKFLTQTALRNQDYDLAAEHLYTLGILCDNAQEQKRSIPLYHKLLHLATEHLLNRQLELTACNVLANAYLNDKRLRAAIKFHTKHLNLSYTPKQKFIAHSNLGLTFLRLELPEHALYHYKHAIEAASQLDSPLAQSVAAGNLAVLIRGKDKRSGERYAKQHATALFYPGLSDLKMTPNTFKSLKTGGPNDSLLEEAEAACDRGDLASGASLFEKVARDAGQRGNIELVEHARAGIGFSRGYMQFGNHCEKLLTLTSLLQSTK